MSPDVAYASCIACCVRQSSYPNCARDQKNGVWLKVIPHNFCDPTKLFNVQRKHPILLSIALHLSWP